MIYSFDATAATHDDLKAGRPEAFRSRIVVVAEDAHEAFLQAYAMAACHGEVTGLYWRI